MKDLGELLDSARASGDYTALIERIPYAVYLGIRIEIDDNDLIFSLPFRDQLVGNTRLPALHGGVIAGFMETAALLHAVWQQDQPRLPSTVDFSIDYLRSAGARDSYARCEATRLGRRVAQVQVRCWQTDETRPVSVARAHFLLAEA